MFLNFKACKHDHYFPSLCKLLACSAPVFLQVHTSVSPRNNSHEFIGAEVLMCCRPIERLAEETISFALAIYVSNLVLLRLQLQQSLSAHWEYSLETSHFTPISEFWNGKGSRHRYRMSCVIL